MPNTPIDGHPMVGQTVTYAPHLPSLAHLPVEPGVSIARPGDTAEVRAVFAEWNGVPGLSMFYVYVAATGMRTHLSPRECGLPTSAAA